MNVLLNNAGVLPPYFTNGEISRETFMKCLNVNVLGTAIISQVCERAHLKFLLVIECFQTFLPLLRKASSLVSGDHLGIDRAAIVNISSFWASIELNEDGSGVLGSLAYKVSKVRIPFE